MIPHNPFSPGHGLVPPYLAGRKVECDLFEQMLADPTAAPRNLLLSGLRGVGKTALLHRFHELAQFAHWVPVWREFGPRQSQEGSFLHAVLSSVVGTVGPALIWRWFGTPAIGFGGDARSTGEVDLAAYLVESFPGTPEDRLSAILRKVVKLLQETGFKGLVLLFDEFQAVRDDARMQEYPLSLFLESVSRLLQDGVPIRLVLSGLPDLLANLVACKTYCERMFTARTVGHLDPDEARLAILLPMREVKAAITPEALDAIVRETRGYPYFLQLFAYELLRLVGMSIDLAAYERARPEILRQLDRSFYAGRFAAAGDAERAALFAMAGAGPEVARGDLQRFLGLGPNHVNQIILSLLEKGLILRTRRARYGFALPLFEQFLAREERRRKAA